MAKQSIAVLFIDPDTPSAERLAQALNGRYTTEVVPSAQAALATLRAHVPHLIVTELDLPDGDGLEFIASLHRSERTRHVLIMVVTTRRSIQDKIAAFQAGSDDYIVKPVSPEHLETHVLLMSRFRRIIGG
jgi:DNA-binding response OmpR family regulator